MWLAKSTAQKSLHDSCNKYINLICFLASNDGSLKHTSASASSPVTPHKIPRVSWDLLLQRETQQNVFSSPGKTDVSSLSTRRLSAEEDVLKGKAAFQHTHVEWEVGGWGGGGGLLLLESCYYLRRWKRELSLAPLSGGPWQRFQRSQTPQSLELCGGITAGKCAHHLS